MIDLTTRSGKYRIVEDAYDGVVRVESKETVSPTVVLLELCTELEELRAAQSKHEELIEVRQLFNLRTLLYEMGWDSVGDPARWLRVKWESLKAKEPAEPLLPLGLGHPFMTHEEAIRAGQKIRAECSMGADFCHFRVPFMEDGRESGEDYCSEPASAHAVQPEKEKGER